VLYAFPFGEFICSESAWIVVAKKQAVSDMD